MKRTAVHMIAVAGLLVAGNAAADGFGLGIKAGTLGAGIEGSIGLTERLSLRLGVNGYSATYDETESDIAYRGDLDLKSSALILDWHPFAGVFRLSAGVMNNKNALHLRAEPTGGNYTIGGQTYSSADVGTLSGDVTLGKKTVGYAGIGWGNAARGKGLGVSFEIGAMFQGEPDVALRSEGGTQSNNPTLQASLRQEEQEAEAELDDFKLYPVISFGLSYGF